MQLLRFHFSLNGKKVITVSEFLSIVRGGTGMRDLCARVEGGKKARLGIAAESLSVRKKR